MVQDKECNKFIAIVKAANCHPRFTQTTGSPFRCKRSWIEWNIIICATSQDIRDIARKSEFSFISPTLRRTGMPTHWYFHSHNSGACIDHKYPEIYFWETKYSSLKTVLQKHSPDIHNDKMPQFPNTWHQCWNKHQHKYRNTWNKGCCDKCSWNVASNKKTINLNQSFFNHSGHFRKSPENLLFKFLVCYKRIKNDFLWIRSPKKGKGQIVHQNLPKME